MALPKKRNEITYKETLPSGKKVEYRPWRVKDEKELMFAIEGVEDRDKILPYVIELLDNCLNEIDIQTLSSVDILAFAIEVYKRAKGEEVEIFYRCPHCDKRPSDPFIMNLNESVTIKPFNESEFEIGDYLFKFKELPYKQQVAIAEKYKDSVQKYRFFQMITSLESVILDGETYNHFTEKEAEDFFDDMEIKEFEELVDKFEEIYSDLIISGTTKCILCGGDVRVYIKDIVDFFV